MDAVSEQRILAHGPSTRIKISENGTALITHLVDGKLQGPRSGSPFAMQVGANGWIGGCSWHEDGAAVRTWAPAAGKPLNISVSPLSIAGGCRMMAEELQGQAGYEDLVGQPDLIWEPCVVLAHAGVDAV